MAKKKKSETITCGDCDKKWPADTKFCPYCEYKL